MNKRIQRKRTKGYKMPENTLYVGRPTKWGNKFKVINEDGSWWIIDTEGNYWRDYPTKEQATKRAVELYGHWLDGQIDSQKLDFSELVGKNLACFCPLSQTCHVDVLLEKLKEI